MLTLCRAILSIPPELIPVFVVLSGLALAHMASILAIHKLEREQRIDKAGGGEARVFQT